MRAAFVALIFAIGCGASGRSAVPTADDAGSGSNGPGDSGLPPDSGVIADAGSTSDAGTTDAGSGAVADAGSTSDAGTTDAGSGTDGGPTSDGGLAAAIESVPCPADPKVLWSRTFTDEVDFRGVAGDDGSLYWIEYDPPPTFLDPAAPAWVA